MDKKDIRNLEKENVMLSGELLKLANRLEDVAIELLNEYKKENVMLSSELLKIANQLEEWASRLSMCDQSIMKEMATNIRHEVRGTKFFRKENDHE